MGGGPVASLSTPHLSKSWASGWEELPALPLSSTPSAPRAASRSLGVPCCCHGPWQPGPRGDLPSWSQRKGRKDFPEATLGVFHWEDMLQAVCLCRSQQQRSRAGDPVLGKHKLRPQPSTQVEPKDTGRGKGTEPQWRLLEHFLCSPLQALGCVPTIPTCTEGQERGGLPEGSWIPKEMGCPPRF